MLSRRAIVAGAGALGLVGLGACSRELKAVAGFAERMVALQQRLGGRLGVCAIAGSGDSKSSGSLSISSDERFAHCSTFKWLLATLILQQADQGKLRLDKAIAYSKADLLDYAPVTTRNVARGHMTLGELCEAAVTLSDNTAANLLLAQIGGPAGLTAFARSLGDSETRFDRTEPDLNSNQDKDPRDTTTPAAMAELLKTVYTGTVLKADSLAQLKTWMVGCQTGLKEIRAGVPAGWTVADKTGRGNGAVNDVAVVWPKNKEGKEGTPVFLAIYTTGGTLSDDARNQIIADTTRLVFDTLDFAQSLGKGSSSASE
jgi:beta-lactamase class A